MADNEMVQRVCLAAAGTLLIVLIGFKLSQVLKLLIVYFLERKRARHPDPAPVVEAAPEPVSMLNHEFIPTQELIGFGLWFRNRFRELLPGKYESLTARYSIRYVAGQGWPIEGYIRIVWQTRSFEMPYEKLTGKDAPDPEFIFFSILWAQCAAELIEKSGKWTRAETICHLADKKTLGYYMTLDRPADIILETFDREFSSDFAATRLDHMRSIVEGRKAAQTV